MTRRKETPEQRRRRVRQARYWMTVFAVARSRKAHYLHDHRDDVFLSLNAVAKFSFPKELIAGTPWRLLSPTSRTRKESRKSANLQRNSDT